jgi:chemotaxis protein methyltransferase CheR
MKVYRPEIEKLINVISSHSNYDFSQYSEKSFNRRIEKVLSDNKLSLEKLTEKLETDTEFLETIVKEITVNTTEIFRDTNTWHILKYKVLQNYINKPTIDIWHVGCSTGQEGLFNTDFVKRNEFVFKNRSVCN